MKKIKEYRIARGYADEPIAFDAQVQKWIRSGYQPYGNLVVATENGRMYFYQPVVKYEE